MEENKTKEGILLALGCYVMWGVSPLYWALINDIDAFEILAYRIIYSLIFMAVLVPILKNRTALRRDWYYIKSDSKRLLMVLACSVLITINWGTFIWGVNNGYVLQSSLGYYIMPLVSIMLALIFEKETFNKIEWIAILMSFIGIAYMIIRIGEVPIIALLLAFSFGFYGLIKKHLIIDATSSISFETIIITPIAIIYAVFLFFTDQSDVGINTSSFWLLFAGAITAVPLILFSKGAKYIPVSLMGFLIYINPTIQFLLGVYVFNEPFEKAQVITFIFIWIGVILYSTSKYRDSKKKRAANV
ncbi:EamA family transporter RarD [Phocicoccus pinnipedialis]|uniref:EamA-like transporter family protein n=1 Tax=Phocicoccus pinnipedialis TaxID=110845 RepID=A0A6V7RDJ0_9BACL|nr:EamA family transporter RarD [Jeotgalicoccus pinnipedialis]MBP1939431.1 chloramphenicol-sensitive protein RarD [Jeotgalicoccus pinnipedialis]CAD2075427.1 EamA-like transporter family protein [Jeotgalicoccus pinnipedialis]